MKDDIAHPEAVLIVARRDMGSSWTGPDQDGAHKPGGTDGYHQAKRKLVRCPGDSAAGPDLPDLGAPKRPDEGTECPICRTRTIVEYWVDDDSWDASRMPANTCIDCFNAHGPDGVELQGVYVRGTGLSFEAEKDDAEGEA